MTHFSGFRPDLDLEPAWSGYGTGVRMALADKPRTPPGERFVYSDINFILMGEIVRVVSGKPLNEYRRRGDLSPAGDERDAIPAAAGLARAHRADGARKRHGAARSGA